MIPAKMSTDKLKQEVNDLTIYLQNKYGIEQADGNIEVEVPSGEPIQGRFSELCLELTKRGITSW